MAVFPYTEKEMDYLCQRDERLARYIVAMGHIEREVDDSIFSSIIHQIIAQQISNKAQAAVWGRMKAAMEAHGRGVTAEEVAHLGTEELRSFGISRGKAAYIQGAARAVLCGECDLDAIARDADGEAVAALTALKGVGVWTAEMVLLFGMLRPNVLSAHDAGIKRGIEIVYGGKANDAAIAEVRSRLAPYCSVASLYFWEAAGVRLP